VVGPPLHLGVAEVLAAGSEDLHHGAVISLTVGVADGAAQLRRLVRVVVLSAGDELGEDGVDGPHFGVLQHLEHVPPAKPGVQVLSPVLQPVTDGADGSLVAPLGQATVQRSTPRLSEAVVVSVARGDLLILVRELELPGDESPLPVAAPLLDGGDHLRAPVTPCLGLVVEEASDEVAELVAEVGVVGLVHRLNVPVHGILAGAVDQ